MYVIYRIVDEIKSIQLLSNKTILEKQNQLFSKHKNTSENVMMTDHDDENVSSNNNEDSNFFVSNNIEYINSGNYWYYIYNISNTNSIYMHVCMCAYRSICMFDII